MGSTAKTLRRLMQLTRTGALAPGARICDIGATQLFGDEAQQASRSFLSFYADMFPKAKRPEHVDAETLQKITQNGFLGDLLILAGFQYTALDIFHATNTVLFDLNIHEPGPELAEKFDLVMNFGTTEHVFNQLRAFQTIHALTKVGGLCYHDLPMAGYLDHALYRYDPLFFRIVLPANNYAVLLQEITLGAEQPVPNDLQEMGYKAPTYTNVGIEVIYRRTSSDPFHIPMETTTSLSVDPDFDQAKEGNLVQIPTHASVHYGTPHSLDTIDTMSFNILTQHWLRRLRHGIGRRLFGW